MREAHGQVHTETPEHLESQAFLRLRAVGVRMTEARRGMVRALSRHHDYVTAEELAREVGRLGVHRATVYRSLEVFAAAGILTQRAAAGGATAYHLATSTHFHGHCAQCQVVVALPTAGLKAVIEQLKNEAGFTLDPHLSSLLGTCEACAQQLRSHYDGP